MMKQLFSLLVFVTLSQSILAQAQEEALNWVAYEFGFEFNEGIYLKYEDFKYNKPAIVVPLEKRGERVYYKNENDSLLQVDPDKVWGYSFQNQIYIANEHRFWRCINIGVLTQFSAILINSYPTVDVYGFQREVQTQNLEQFFLDMNDGKIKVLKYKNIEPYLLEEPLLANYVKKRRKAKHKELILTLRAYNKLNTLYFPVYE